MGLLDDDTLVIMESPVPDAEGLRAHLPVCPHPRKVVRHPQRRRSIQIAGTPPEKEKSPRRGSKLFFFVNIHPRIQGRRRHGDGDVGVV